MTLGLRSSFLPFFTGSRDGLLQKAVLSRWDVERVTRVRQRSRSGAKLCFPIPPTGIHTGPGSRAQYCDPWLPGHVTFPLPHPALEGKLRLPPLYETQHAAKTYPDPGWEPGSNPHPLPASPMTHCCSLRGAPSP